MIKIDENKCIACRACAADCLSNAIAFPDGKARIVKSCFLCGHCIAICPVSAVSMDDYDMAEVLPFQKETFTISPEILMDVMKFRRSIRQFNKRAERIPPSSKRSVGGGMNFGKARFFFCISY